MAVTDRDWYEQLRADGPDEVNFWRPGGKQAFRALRPGGPFLFKLHYPAHAIAGGGWFVRFAFLPMSAAWLALPEHLDLRALSDHAIDALTCIVAGVDFASGTAAPPRHYARAEVEAWIWVRCPQALQATPQPNQADR